MQHNSLSERTANRKLLILDPSLKNMGGHYYEYDVAIAAAASLRGWHTSIYAHKSCDAGLTLPDGNIYPWFSTEWSAAGGRAKTLVQNLLSKLPLTLRIPLTKLGRRIWEQLKRRSGKPVEPETVTISATAENFGDEASAVLRHVNCAHDDIIFVPTIRTSELFALWNVVRNEADLSRLHFHIVLRRNAAEMDRQEDGAPGISFLFRELHAMPAGGIFHFYCDTQQLCNDYALLASHQLKFQLLPIPFPNTCPDHASLERWSAGSAIKFIYLGGARVEKGFHLIAIAEKYMRNICDGNFLWRIQAPKGRALEEPEVIAARRSLTSVRDGSVDLVERNLSTAEFQSLILSADIVLFPYLSEFYRARSSGILAQVLAAGKPVIVPSGTWLSSQTDKIGAVEFATSFDFPNAVLQATQQLPKLTKEAQDRAAAYAAFHNADALLRILESGAPRRES
jgi:hypothetical protein